MTPTIIRPCLHCGAPKPRHGQRFCSRACWRAAQPLQSLRRFWRNVDEAPTGCWVWTRHTNAGGYGSVNHGGRMQLAHRVAWQLMVGPIPDGLCVLHHCDNPPCVNPDHLFLGTKQDNVDDMRSKGRGHYLRGDESYWHQHPEQCRRGEQLTWTKLTADQVRAIRAAYATGTTTHKELARRFGIGLSTVGHIVQRRSWKHVE